MGATTKLSFEEFQQLQESAGENVRYELDEGELILTPSPTPRHNLVSSRLWRSLTAFVETHHLGIVICETDFRLSATMVRKPDVAFVAKEHLTDFDPDHTPIEGAPTLAVEIISPGNLAQDTLKKVRQYLAAGAQAVWLVYPALRLIEIHDRAGVREITEPHLLVEDRLFPKLKFSLSPGELFDQIPGDNEKPHEKQRLDLRTPAAQLNNRLSPTAFS